MISHRIHRFWLRSFIGPVLLAAAVVLPPAACQEDREELFDNCTSIMVGKLASADGSTTTSHSCDSNSDRTWMEMVPRRKYPPGQLCTVYLQSKQTRGPQDTARTAAGEIPQVAETYAYLNAAYPVMNEFQLAIGETTIGGRRELISKNGIIDAPELFRLLLERARTAREAIRLAGELTANYGYTDYGESLTFADPKEVWLFEIYGPGEGNKGSVWAARRIPDGHVSVSANASRLRTLDLNDPDNYMASPNVLSLAEEMGWWDAKSGQPFEFCYAYAPKSRTSIGCRRREWRVLSLLAPSLNLDPNSEHYPFSVKPDRKVSIQDVLSVFRDHYQDTEFDFTKILLAMDKNGQAVKNLAACPFLGAEWRDLLRVKRERYICSPTCTYLQITQSREWLPDAVGGIVWLGYDLPAATPHTPFYCGITRMPVGYTVDGRREYSRECAWWAFRSVVKLAFLRWQEMSGDIERVWRDIEERTFTSQAAVETEALRLYRQDPEKARQYLTRYCDETASKAVEAYWKLFGELMVKYSARF